MSCAKLSCLLFGKATCQTASKLWKLRTSLWTNVSVWQWCSHRNPSSNHHAQLVNSPSAKISFHHFSDSLKRETLKEKSNDRVFVEVFSSQLTHETIRHVKSPPSWVYQSLPRGPDLMVKLEVTQLFATNMSWLKGDPVKRLEIAVEHFVVEDFLGVQQCIRVWKIDATCLKKWTCVLIDALMMNIWVRGLFHKIKNNFKRNLDTCNSSVPIDSSWNHMAIRIHFWWAINWMMNQFFTNWKWLDITISIHQHLNSCFWFP